MPLVKPATFNMNSIARDMNPGDIPDFSENLLTVINSDVGVTLTAAQIVVADIDRTGTAAGGISDTLPTAQQIISALAGNKDVYSPPGNALYGTEPNKSLTLQWPGGLGTIPPGSSFRRTIRNNALTNTLTIATAAGITLSGTMTIATSKWREFLFRILNSTPSATLSVTTTNTSKSLSAVDLNLINQITPGMTVSGTGITAGTLVDGVDRNAGTIHLDTAATANGTLIGLLFTPTIIVQNIRAGDI